jgi:transketolase
MSLRLIPDFLTMRPADAYETEAMFRKALEFNGPSAICLSRQKLPILDLTPERRSEAARGGYIVRECLQPKMLIVATGSEVSLALAVAAHVDPETDPAKRTVRVVSLPCWELFFAQPKSWQDSVLPPSCNARVSIEAGSTLGWQKIIGQHGLAIGIDTFGASAPAEALAEEFGFTVAQVVGRIKAHFV